eukprot:TRINITY_DN9547_c0_g1_i1.p1 TRINITY_DN9547_c0_g1~~TRINITY_DN9547_c0_g1_i1.p1  ORF type:complete len:585 (+),score=64.08 TRINITY_DN9547_c0_g1_i1:94-1848(+)
MGELLSGVIEGFYGKPWTQKQRLELIDTISFCKLNTYFYAPKDDNKQRNFWKELYSSEECLVLSEVIQKCSSHSVKFIYALSPGLSIEYSNHQDLNATKEKFGQLLKLGCCNFALLWDDIKPKLSEEDSKHYKSVAEAQASFTNKVYEWIASKVPNAFNFLFCPTVYCSMMCGGESKLSSDEYLITLGNILHQNIMVLWTGPDIIAERILPSHLTTLESVIKRKPLIWDNLFANDYDNVRLYLGPFDGRPTDIKKLVQGILLNPNCEYSTNFVGMYTLGRWIHDDAYNIASVLPSAIEAWLPKFKCKSQDSEHIFTEEDLALLIDLFYLPHSNGKRAKTFLNTAASVLSSINSNIEDITPNIKNLQQQCASIARLFTNITYLEDRDICYDLYKYLWDVKEECDAISTVTEHWSSSRRSEPAKSKFHKQGTYRGGFLNDLRKLLEFKENEAFTPNLSHLLSAKTVGFRIEKYKPEYEDGGCFVCLATSNSGQDGTLLFPDHPKIVGHRYFSPYCHLQPDLAFILLDDEGPCGYVLGALDTKSFYQRLRSEWLPKMRNEYKEPTTPAEKRTPAENLAYSFYHPFFF